MILALDISLSELGIAVFDSAGNLVYGECIITKPVKKKLNARIINSDHLRTKEIALRLLCFINNTISWGLSHCGLE